MYIDEPQSTCSCRKSGCDLLYCPCFGDGRKCSDACKCKNCKNPKGVNPKSVYTGKEKKKREKEQAEEAKKFKQLLMLTVSPGRLGLTLSIDGEGGALITNVDPACTFRGQVVIGDRIMTVDGEKVYTLEDAKRGKDRVRKFGILKAATVSLASQTMQLPPLKLPPTQKRGGPSFGSRADPRKQTFPFLTELEAIGTDRDAEHRRENLMAELLQWDKRNKVNVSVFHVSYYILVLSLFTIKYHVLTLRYSWLCYRLNARWDHLNIKYYASHSGVENP
jgi:hypothetical protein